MMSSVLFKSLTGGLLAKFGTPITPSVNQGVRYKKQCAWPLFNYTQPQKRKIKLRKQESYILESECSANWELLAIEDNRFFLPRRIGLAWQDALTILSIENPLDGLVEFQNARDYFSRMRLRVLRCPDVLHPSLECLFPTVQYVPVEESLTLIELSYEGVDELGPQIFLLAAHELTKSLRAKGFWADFINPFSGKPFHEEEIKTGLYKQEELVAGHRLEVTTICDCVVVTENKSQDTFGGSIFSNAPSDMEKLCKLLEGFQIRQVQ